MQFLPHSFQKSPIRKQNKITHHLGLQCNLETDTTNFNFLVNGKINSRCQQSDPKTSKQRIQGSRKNEKCSMVLMTVKQILMVNIIHHIKYGLLSRGRGHTLNREILRENCET